MNRERGYAFSLPLLLARLSGEPVRRAELCRWEAYGFGALVFGLACLFIGQILLPFVRPGFLRLLAIALLPFATWIAFLLLYYVNALTAGALRRLGLYRAPTNNSWQHIIIMTLTTLFALWLARQESTFLCSLGWLWLGLLGLNLLALSILKLRHETWPSA